MKLYKKTALLMIFVFVVGLSTCTVVSPEEPLYLNEMLQYAQERLAQVPGNSLGNIAADFDNYILGPNPLFRLFFGGNKTSPARFSL